MKRKLLALLLVLALAVSVLPLAAYAEEGEAENQTSDVVTTDDTTKTDEPVPKNDEAVPTDDTKTDDAATTDNTATDDTITTDDTTTTDDAPIDYDHCPDGDWHDFVFDPAGTINEDGHSVKCSKCGLKLEAFHHDLDNDGACDDCGYTNFCNHKFVFDPDGTIDENYHSQKCSKCGLEVMDSHYDGNHDGKCDTCGYKDSCEHEFEDLDAHFHVCKKCGRTEAHWWYDNGTWNETCRACGKVCGHEKKSWFADGQHGHAQYCETCGMELVPFEDHTMVNGVCTKCGYQMSSPTDPSEPSTPTTPTNPTTPAQPSGDTGLDRVPRTGGIALAVTGGVALLFGGAALAVKKFTL